MRTKEIYLIENNQEINIEPSKLKKGDKIREILKENGEIKFNTVFELLDNPNENTTMIFGKEYTRGLVVEAKILVINNVVSRSNKTLEISFL